MRRWPPIVWPLMTVASLLIIMGGTGGWRAPYLIAGGVLALAVLALSMYIATHRWEGQPRPPIVWLALGGLMAFYLLVAVAAATAGPEYAVAALAAAVVPLAALSLLIAMARSKTVESEGRLHDLSADRDDDPYPGIGMNDATPLGDTPEHSDELDGPAGRAYRHER